jgi:hypothetical protein
MHLILYTFFKKNQIGYSILNKFRRSVKLPDALKKTKATEKSSAHLMNIFQIPQTSAAQHEKLSTFLLISVTLKNRETDNVSY